MTVENVFNLPPIALDALSEGAKDLILGLASGLQTTPEAVIVRLLDRAAALQLSPPPVSPQPQEEVGA